MSTEKQSIIDYVVNLPIDAAQSIGVEANPGSGKTYLLVQLAEKLANYKILYVAFNAAIVKEASRKVPDNVDVYTVNSLSTKWAYTHSNLMKKQQRHYNASLLSNALNCTYKEASDFNRELTTWCQSAERFESEFTQSSLFNQYFDLMEEGKIEWSFDIGFFVGWFCGLDLEPGDLSRVRLGPVLTRLAVFSPMGILNHVLRGVAIHCLACLPISSELRHRHIAVGSLESIIFGPGGGTGRRTPPHKGSHAQN